MRLRYELIGVGIYFFWLGLHYSLDLIQSKMVHFGLRGCHLGFLVYLRLHISCFCSVVIFYHVIRNINDTVD